MTAAAADWSRELSEVDRRLRERADELVEHFRGAPNKALSNKRTIRFGSKGGLAVDVAGSKRGRITDFNDGGNKALSPLQFIQAEIGGNFAGAVEWARAWLGIEGEFPDSKAKRANQEHSSAEAEQEEAERRAKRAKVDKIVAQSRDVRGTAAEAYLRGRGIAAELPPAVRWRAGAWKRGGSLVLLATDAAGGIKAVQQVYVTAEGAKAPIVVQKRSNGSFAGAAVRLPGTAPLTLAEGPETGLSVWQSTGCETWIALGGIGKLVEQVPAGVEVVVARDADAKGSAPDKALRRAVDELVERGCRVRLACPPRYPELRKTDFNDVLKREGEAAIRAIVAAAEGICGRAADRGAPAAHYPAAVLPLDRATVLLDRTVRDFVAHAVTHTEGVRARQTGVKGAAGIGKSRAVLRALQARPEALERHIDIFVPQHRLADEFAREAAGGRLKVRVIRGREYERADGSTMCAKAKEAGKVARAGFGVWETMCKRVDPETEEVETCEHFATCPYVAQFADPDPSVRIMPHESMFLPRNGGLPKAQAVVIDESFHARAVKQTDFPLDRLNSGLLRSFGHKVSMDDQDRRDRIARAVRRALEVGKHPRDHGVTAEDCQFAAKLEIGSRDGIGITPGMDHAAQRKRLEDYQRSEALRLYRFWRILEAEIERDGPLRQIELRRDVVKGSDEPRHRIYLHWRTDLELPDVPVLLLDADLDPTIGRKFLPRLEVVDVPVDRCAEVVQVRDTVCSRMRLLAWDTAPDTEVSRAANRLADVQALLDVEAAKGARVLVVTYKPAAACLKVPAGCAVEHFGNIRGIDRYKHFDTIIVAGREQPSVDVVEAQARALFADDAEPLKLSGELVELERAYRMRDGSNAAAKVWVHSDPRVQALLEQVREREIGQAIDRLRLVHRATPARVLVLSSVVLDLTVDRLTTWREIMPTRLERAAARGPAVPLSASELARCFPDLWATAKAAEREQDKSPFSHIESLIGKRGIYPEGVYAGGIYRAAKYRRGNQKRPTPALIRADAADPRAALEAVVGPVVWFEVEPVEAPQVQADSPRPTASQSPPPTADELESANRILAAAGRLADLSERLDRARPLSMAEYLQKPMPDEFCACIAALEASIGTRRATHA